MHNFSVWSKNKMKNSKTAQYTNNKTAQYINNNKLQCTNNKTAWCTNNKTAYYTNNKTALCTHNKTTQYTKRESKETSFCSNHQRQFLSIGPKLKKNYTPKTTCYTNGINYSTTGTIFSHTSIML